MANQIGELGPADLIDAADSAPDRGAGKAHVESACKDLRDKLILAAHGAVGNAVDPDVAVGLSLDLFDRLLDPLLLMAYAREDVVEVKSVNGVVSCGSCCVGCGSLGSGLVGAAACRHGKNHNERQRQAKHLLHFPVRMSHKFSDI